MLIPSPRPREQQHSNRELSKYHACQNIMRWGLWGICLTASLPLVFSTVLTHACSRADTARLKQTLTDSPLGLSVGLQPPLLTQPSHIELVALLCRVSQFPEGHITFPTNPHSLPIYPKPLLSSLRPVFTSERDKLGGNMDDPGFAERVSQASSSGRGALKAVTVSA